MFNFTIITDSREQLPYTFKNIKTPPRVVTQGLKTGDYSLLGLEDLVCVERKSMADLFGSIGKGRKRFKAESERMSKFDYAALVIETSLAGIFINPPARSCMNPKVVFRTLLSWSVKYNIHVWPAWNREAGEKITYLLLKRYYDQYILTSQKQIK